MPPESRIPNEIISRNLPIEENIFSELSTSAHLEELGKGRRGAVLTKTDEVNGAPIVRTTTRYSSPAQHFRRVHEHLAQLIQDRAGLSVGFNNALIEIYTNTYKTMGSHSDQALDLASDSFIAVFSCYQHPKETPPRKLLFESKGPDAEKFEIPLDHNSIVAFSVDSNRRFKHKIVLDTPSEAADNQWLGVTFRTSTTFVRFLDGHAYLPQGVHLTSANEEQRREFYQLRRRENNETGFAYPLLTYTISESDLIPPT